MACPVPAPCSALLPQHCPRRLIARCYSSAYGVAMRPLMPAINSPAPRAAPARASRTETSRLGTAAVQRRRTMEVESLGFILQPTRGPAQPTFQKAGPRSHRFGQISKRPHPVGGAEIPPLASVSSPGLTRHPSCARALGVPASAKRWSSMEITGRVPALDPTALALDGLTPPCTVSGSSAWSGEQPRLQAPVQHPGSPDD
jgi:hypothetical protein